MTSKKMKFAHDFVKDYLNDDGSQTTINTFLSETQYTETSYTSASLETLPTPVDTSYIIIRPKKRKKDKKKMSESHQADLGRSSRQSRASRGSRGSRMSHMSGISEKSSVSVDVFSDVSHEDVTKKQKKKKEKKGKDGAERLPNFPKPDNWKAMTDVQRDEWMRKRIIKYRKDMEIEKQEKLALAKLKKRQDLIDRMRLIEQEEKNQEVRRDILAKTVALFQSYEKNKIENDLEELIQLQWMNYVNCNRLPDPVEAPQLNAYLKMWKSEPLQSCTIDNLAKKYEDVFPILETIDLFITHKCLLTPEAMKNINEARLELRNQLSEALDSAYYFILQDLEHNFQSSGASAIITYHKQVKNLDLNVWVAVKQPTRYKIKHVYEEPPEPLHLNFPTIETDVTLPGTIDPAGLCVRLAQCKIDFFSANNANYDMKLNMPHYDEDLMQLNEREYEHLKEIRADANEQCEKFYRETAERLKELDRIIKTNSKAFAEREEFEALHFAEPPAFNIRQNPRLKLTRESEDELKLFLARCVPALQLGEINLRKYRVCGGVMYVDLVEAPPQYKYNARKVMNMRTVTIPRKLKVISLEKDYHTMRRESSIVIPTPSTPRSPSMRSTHMKTDVRSGMDDDRLVCIKMMLPSHVFWVDTPKVCQWQENQMLWTTNHVYDVQQRSLGDPIQFKVANLWPIGFAQNKYYNMPYVNWELKKDSAGKGIRLILNGQHLSLTLLCRGRYVILKEVSKGKDIFADLIDKPMVLPKLKRALQDAGLDLFPEADSHLYMKGSCVKVAVLENHFYHAMAFLSKAYHFKFSKWNRKVGVRVIICQAREHVDKKRERKFRLLCVTPDQTTLLETPEESKDFSYLSALPHEFFPDLYTFNVNYGSVEAKQRAYKMGHKLTETVSDLLQAVRPCSFG